MADLLAHIKNVAILSYFFLMNYFPLKFNISMAAESVIHGVISDAWYASGRD